MTETERDKLKAKLDKLSSRLDAHVRDLKERGQFTEEHRNLIAEISQRRDQMQRKLALAEAKGTPWEVFKCETECDFRSLFDDLLQINERLDADEMKADKVR